MFIMRLEQKVRQAMASTESAIKSSFADGDEGGALAADDAAVLREMLVENELKQVLILREYQKLFAEKERRIQELEGRAEEADDGENCSGQGNNGTPFSRPAGGKPASDAAAERAGEDDAESKSSASPRRDEPDAAWAAEWEDHMRGTLREKVAALAEARELRETVKALQQQQGSLKHHIQLQDQQRDDMERLLKRLQEKEDNALDHLADDYSALVRESDGVRQKLAEAQREMQALQAEKERQGRQLSLLMGAATGDASAVDAAAGDAATAALRAQVAALEVELAQERERAKAAAADLERREAAATGGAESRAAELEQRIHDADDRAQAAGAALAEAQARVASLTAAVASEGEAKAAAEASVTAQLARVAELEGELAAARAAAEAQSLRSDELTALKDDLQSSVAAMEEAVATHKAEGDAARAELERAAAGLAGLRAELEAVQARCAQLDAAAAELEASKAAELSAARSEAAEALVATKAAAEAELAEALGRAQAQHGDALAAERAQAEAAAKAVEEAHSSALKALETERDDALVAMAQLKAEAEREMAEAVAKFEADKEAARLAAVEETQARMEGEVAEFKRLYVKESALRKRVHNELMDLRGNIRVFCRVRPILAHELKQGKEQSLNVAEFPVDNEIVLARDDVTANRFEFDSVFEPQATQEAVFEDISPLVISVLDGYNVCIFAYGQTGSGKTHTMEGTEADPGVNLRALSALFALREERQNDEEYRFTVSILEIYNETVRDLLTKAGRGSKAALDLRVGQDGKVFVQGLEEMTVDSMSDVRTAIRTAQGNRAVGAHNMNEHSSRSHLVLTINTHSRNLISGQECQGKLNLIDLAGSERVGKTDATGDRLKEAQNINKSLSALGDVIAALGQSKQAHVPFRNSKLTHLLQNSLGGDSKVAMFVNISPVKWNVGESTCSLNFASRCRKVQLGQARKNGESTDLRKYKQMVDDLKSQLAAQSRNFSSSANSTPKKPGRR